MNVLWLFATTMTI